MNKTYQFTDTFIQSFNDFTQTDEFSELLGVIWRYGHFHGYNMKFEVSHKNKEVVERFATLVPGATPVKSRYRSHKGFHEWHSNIHVSHPLLKIIKRMGWSPRQKQERTYPKGVINHAIFIKTYILMRHDVGIMRENRMKGAFIRPRLRIHGSADILQHIAQHLYKKLGVGLKKIQTDSKVHRAKTLYYQSPKEISSILEYIGAKKTMDKFHSLRLGYEKSGSVAKFLPS